MRSPWDSSPPLHPPSQYENGPKHLRKPTSRRGMLWVVPQQQLVTIPYLLCPTYLLSCSAIASHVLLCPPYCPPALSTYPSPPPPVSSFPNIAASKREGKAILKSIPTATVAPSPQIPLHRSRHLRVLMHIIWRAPHTHRHPILGSSNNSLSGSLLSLFLSCVSVSPAEGRRSSVLLRTMPPLQIPNSQSTSESFPEHLSACGAERVGIFHPPHQLLRPWLEARVPNVQLGSCSAAATSHTQRPPIEADLSCKQARTKHPKPLKLGP